MNGETPYERLRLSRKARSAGFRFVTYTNPSGSQSWRVTGWIDGRRIRENNENEAVALARREELEAKTGAPDLNRIEAALGQLTAALNRFLAVAMEPPAPSLPSPPPALRPCAPKPEAAEVAHSAVLIPTSAVVTSFGEIIQPAPARRTVVGWLVANGVRRVRLSSGRRGGASHLRHRADVERLQQRLVAGKL